MADQFIRVRLTRIENVDLHLFDFDYDLTFIVFFFDAERHVYARYGGRDANDPDALQSLDGLRFTMQSVLRMHQRADKLFAPRQEEKPQYLRDLAGFRRRGCVHCHQAKEMLNRDRENKGVARDDLAWRYPLPANIGLELEVDRGNLVTKVHEPSPAAKAGLRPGDEVQRLNGVPIHSMADVQFALDRAPKAGTAEIAWQRGDRAMTETLALTKGWRKTDLSWRPSMQDWLAAGRLYGVDLSAEQKRALGLTTQRLAFRQNDSLSAQAKMAGIRPGDIIVGMDDKPLEMDVIGFGKYVSGHYLIGDQATVNVLRDGKPLRLPMTFVANAP